MLSMQSTILPLTTRWRIVGAYCNYYISALYY